MNVKIIFKIHSQQKKNWISSIRFFNVYILQLKSIGNKHDVYRDKDCIKKFFESLRKHAIKIINLKINKWSY